ncbi:MAG: hypothetical protein H5U33_08085, partial [Pseudomonas sp.]|nr:hypothetical protein [Pseudomonas sp.]
MSLMTNLCLGWCPPYDVEAMLGFLRLRAIPGLEWVEGRQYARTLRLVQDSQACSGWLSVSLDDERAQAQLTISDSLASVLPMLINRVRTAFDLDADPVAIHRVLQASFPTREGMRVPGTLDGFELAVRAVLGQQITVVAARTLSKVNYKNNVNLIIVAASLGFGMIPIAAPT